MIGRREVAQQSGIYHNALLPIRYAEERHIAPIPCMKEEYSPINNTVVPPSTYGAQFTHLQHRLSLIEQGHKWNRFVAVVVLSFTIASCASSARIVNETATGGTVLYLYTEEQEVLASAGRRDALRLLDEKCPTGYTISREGRISLIDNAVDKAWMGQVSRDGQPSREKRWAIEFACK